MTNTEKTKKGGLENNRQNNLHSNFIKEQVLKTKKMYADYNNFVKFGRAAELKIKYFS